MISDDRPLMRPPVLMPLFPVTTCVPKSECPHGRWQVVEVDGQLTRVWIRSRTPPKGSALICMVCHKSGKEGHPALKRDPFTDPRPEPKPVEEPGVPEITRPTTRRQKRAAMFGAAAILADPIPS